MNTTYYTNTIMKKILFTVALFSSFCLSSLQAKKSKDAKLNKVELKTATDSLSYSFGLETGKQGLEQYLVQIGVLGDTTVVNSNFKAQINNATNDTEKAQLQKKLQAQLDSILTSNNANLNAFAEGMYARINSQEADAYKKGMDLASQIEMMGKNFQEQTLDDNADKISLNLVVAGITDAITHKTPRVSNSAKMVEDKVQAAKDRKTKKDKEMNAEKIAENEAFMAENAKKEGVKTLPSGIQYKIEKEGKGAIPTASDRVKVHYSGRLLNGTEFDSSIKRGEPITFGVQQVIPGWTEVLQLMPVGSKWTIYIPYSLAYGEQGAGPIPAYSNLIFDIELLDIEK